VGVILLHGAVPTVNVLQIIVRLVADRHGQVQEEEFADSQSLIKTHPRLHWVNGAIVIITVKVESVMYAEDLDVRIDFGLVKIFRQIHNANGDRGIDVKDVLVEKPIRKRLLVIGMMQQVA